MDPPPTKLRIMCSYGGHIVPRPRTKSLCYAGGETRIVSLNPVNTTSLSSLVSHLSSSLSIQAPFSLKYQLPKHDLDSLISLLADDDLLVMLDKLQRLSSSSSRIRLFVFSAKSETKSAQSVIQHPKTEAWFVDALKSAKIMQKGRNCQLGFEGEAQISEDLIGNGFGFGSSSMAESMALETSSSFGSTSSSASLTNLAPVKSNVEEGTAGVQDSKVKFTSSDAIASESTVPTASSCPQTGAYQDPANSIHAAATDSVCPKIGELDKKGSDVSSGIQVHNTVLVSPYALDRVQQQKVQYVQLDLPYIPQNTPGFVPISSFYPLYHTQMPQQQLMQFQYQPNQPPPVYLLPVAPTQAYNLPLYSGFIENPAMASRQTPVHLNPLYIPPPQVVQNEPTPTDASPNFASHVYNAPHSTIQFVGAPPLLPVLYNENEQQSLGLLETQQQPHSVAIPDRESPKPSNELDDDPAHVQIYKSQPPPPSCPSHYQPMNKETAVLLSEALDQLHTDSLKQQIRISQPQ